MSEVTDITDFILGRRQDAAQTAVGAIGEDPENAARALKLSTMSGVPAAAIEPDVENFENEQKAAATAQLIQNNQQLATYVNSHLLAPKVSNDDYATLDTISQSLSKRSSKGIMQASFEGFKEGFGELQLGEWLYKRPQDIEFAQNYPALAAMASVIGAPLEGVSKIIGGGIGAIRGGATEAYKYIPGTTESGAESFGREMAAIAEMRTTQPFAIPHKPKLPEVMDAASRARPYLEAGVEPLVGVHPIIDNLKAEQHKLEMKAYEESLKESQQSLTRERSPELFAEFIRQHTPDHIGINIAAIEKMYGEEKAPIPGDSKLGWIPNIEEQFRVAKETGGDIEVPLADWLAKVDPGIARELKDDLRLRRNGVTSNEVKEFKALPMVEAYHGSPHTFEAFKTEAIGTGEGAQAYGHGLYFAENRGVAESYKQGAMKYAGWTTTGDVPEVPPGNTYRVRINAEKEHFLDWDKRHDEQSSQVQEALSKLGISLPTKSHRGQELYQEARAEIGRRGVSDKLPEQLREGSAYAKSLTKESAEQASKMLAEAGIPGIRYLDQGSRKVGGGVRIDDLIAPLMDRFNGDQVKVIAELEGRIEGTKELAPVYRSEQGLARIQEAIDALKSGEWKDPRSYNYVIFDPSIIEITHINDAAIEAIRSSADLKPLLDRKWTPDQLSNIADIMESKWMEYGPGLRALIPEEKWFPIEKQAIEAANAELGKLLPKAVEPVPARMVEFNEQGVQGVFQQYADRIPAIVYLVNPETSVGTIRHEAIHYLRRQGFFTPEEWTTLKQAAHYNNWIDKHDIKTRYKELVEKQDAATLIEEAIAEEFKDWRKKPETTTLAGKVFQKLQDLSEKVVDAIKRAIGAEQDAYKIFERVESGEIGGREGAKPLDPKAFAQQPDLAQQEMFAKANAIGMTADQYARYRKLIDKRNSEDMEYARTKAIKAEKKRQTDEWKANEASMRPEVVSDVLARPDIAVEAFFREGNLFGKKSDVMPKLNEGLLTEEQKAALPKSYISPRGLAPEEVASLFGYTDGKSMVEQLISFRQAMKDSGVRAEEYKRMLIKQELDRRMEQKYGDLNENILREAEEHVLSSTQMDLLHEETVALGTKAGFDAAQITKEHMQAWVEQSFAGINAMRVKTDKFLADAGRAGKMAEMELLKGGFQEAFKHKQRQYVAILLAKEAKALDKEIESFNKTAKRLSPREIKNIDQDYVDFAQSLLGLAGLPIRRTAGEIKDSVAKSGFTSLDNFVETKLGDGYELAVSDPLRQGQVKPVKDMTVQEFREFKDAIDSLAHIGKLEKQIQVGQQKLELEELRSSVLENIRTLPPTNYKSMMRWLFRADAELVKIEEVVKDLDLRKAGGVLFDSLVRPLADAKTKEYTMLDKLSKELGEIKGFGKDWRKTLDDSIPQDFLVDPLTNSPYDLTREHMVNIMLNFGNRSNIDKFTKAYGGKQYLALENKLKQMFDQHTTKEDWQYVQKVWDLFETWRKEADTMYRNLSGVPPKWIQVAPVDTAHGQFKGGYFPIIYDKLRSNQNVIEEKKGTKGTFDNDYFRATTGSGYTKQRTGYVDYIQFENSIEAVAGRMQQMIHDISHREAVINAGKIIYDPGIRAAIRKHYGMEYEKQLHPWLKDIANHFNVDELATAETNSWLRRFRFNLVSHALGLNLRVILSPNPGLFNPVNAAGFWMNRKANVELAMQHSQEIPHIMRSIDRDFREKLEQTMKTKGWDNVQSTAFRWAFYPIVGLERELRLVAFSKEFKQAVREGMSEPDAAARADSLLRERQGTAGSMDLPAIMRSNEAMKMATMFYGFFNTMYNWQRQIPGQVRRHEFGEAMKTVYGAILLPSAFSAVLFTSQKKDESWFSTIAKSLALQPLSTIPIMREGASYMLEGFPSRTPFESLITAANSIVSDVKKYKAGKPIDKPITHAANVVGLTAGLPLGQLGRSTQFGYDVAKGKQKPKNILEWMRGIISGEARPKK